MQKLFRSVMLLGGLLLTASPAPAAATPPVGLLTAGRVTRVVDGDTYDVRTGGMTVRVRVRYVDCPENTQPFGKQATDSVGKLLLGRLVYLAPTGKDLYGRTLAAVWLPRVGTAGRLVRVDSLLVVRGWAWAAGGTGTVSAGLWVSQQLAAQAARRGLWTCAASGMAAVPPPVWRGLSAANKRRFRRACRW